MKDLPSSKNVCKAIYLDFHVSELSKFPRSVRDAWEIGRKLCSVPGNIQEKMIVNSVKEAEDE